jgi:hypothetical protein
LCDYRASVRLESKHHLPPKSEPEGLHPPPKRELERELHPPPNREPKSKLHPPPKTNLEDYTMDIHLSEKKGGND